MVGLLNLTARFGTDGYASSKCGGSKVRRLAGQPQVHKCGACHHQATVPSGTVFHRTRTALPKWFLAAYLMGNNKRSVSTKSLQRKLGAAGQTAWAMTRKPYHGLSEGPSYLRSGFLKADETFVGGRSDPSSPGQGTDNPDKSLTAAPSNAPRSPMTRSSTEPWWATPTGIDASPFQL